MKEHFWLSSQPVEEPPKREYFDLLLEQLNAREKADVRNRLSALGLRCARSCFPDEYCTGRKAADYGG